MRMRSLSLALTRSAASRLAFARACSSAARCFASSGDNLAFGFCMTKTHFEARYSAVAPGSGPRRENKQAPVTW